MSEVLKITNVPGYITEAEFKRIWTQPGLDCQGCSFIKTGSNGETVGYAQFASPQAAARAENIYQGWQGYGNPEGLRIEFVTEEGSMTAKRPREDVGEDQAFKQTRVMGGNSMGYNGGGGGGAAGGFQNSSGPRLAENAGFNPMQPNLGAGAGPPKPMGNPGGFQMQTSAPSNGNPSFAGSQMSQQGFMGGQAPQGMAGNPQISQGTQLQGGASGVTGQPGQGIPGQVAGQVAGDPRGMPAQGGQDPRGLPGQLPPQGLQGSGQEARGMQGQGQGLMGPGQGGSDPRGMQGQGPQGLMGPGQGLPSQGLGPQAGGGMTTSQAYNTSGSMGFSSGPGMAMGQPQRQLNMQQPQFTGQDQGTMKPPQFQQQPNLQQQANLQQQQQGSLLQQNVPQGQTVQQGGQFNPNAPGMQLGNVAPQFGSTGLSYDPHNPQIPGGQQGLVQPHPQQQPQQMLQQQPQILPQQLASIADVLGPLLQQQGIQGLGNINLGQLQQGLGAGLAQQGLMQAPPMQQQGMSALNAPVQLPTPQMLGQIAGPMQAGRMTEPLPHDAVETLYVDNMTMDVTKREMTHVFRPFEGFKEMRIVERKDKNGTPLVIGFAEFSDTHRANVALKALQGYPLDMSCPAENQLRLSFAKPLKANDPRARGHNKAFHNSNIYSKPLGQVNRMQADDGTAGLRGERVGREVAPVPRAAATLLPVLEKRDSNKRDRPERPPRNNFSGPERGERRPERRPRY